MDNSKIVGSCSICGGLVTIPNYLHSVTKPIPICQNCGATMKLPEIPMVPMKEKKFYSKPQCWTYELRFPKAIF